MNSANRWDCILKDVGWMVGGVEILLLTAVAPAFFEKLLLVQGSVPFALLSLYVANWAYATQPARKPISQAHNRQKTPLFAKSIERHALRDK